MLFNVPPRKSPIEDLIVFETFRGPQKQGQIKDHAYRTESQEVMMGLFTAAHVSYSVRHISHVDEYICTFSNPIKLTSGWISQLESIHPKGKIYMEKDVFYRGEFYYETYELPSVGEQK